MGLHRNSVWKVIGEENVDFPSLFRVLDIFSGDDLVVVYGLDRPKNKLLKPQGLSLKKIAESIQEGILGPKDFDLPGYVSLSNDELKEEWKNKRDENYSLISPLVENKDFLRYLLLNPRSKLIVNHAALSKKQPSAIYRLLNQYWRFGQTESALNPAYINCGGRGKQKISTYRKRGRPRDESQFGFDWGLGLNVSEQDKENIKDAIRRHFKEEKKNVKSKIWQTFKEFYADEIFAAVEQKREAQYPNYRQFCYWLPLLVDEVALEKQELGEIAWEKDHRALLGSVSENVSAPGDIFEIDSTVADVYIVSEVDPDRVIGRPVIYVIVDEASRMVVGLHVSIENASWKEAKLALLNAFLPKKEYCERYGLNYDDLDWPCSHIPRYLLADRAEFLGSSSERHVTELGLQIGLASKLRGDWKSVVERKFGIANEQSLHDLPGTTRGQIKKRGEKDPSEYAFYSLNEITKLLITLFVEYNKSQQIDNLIVKGLIRLDKEPTPFNFWNYHIENHTDSLSTIDPEQARAELLPSVMATVTAKGIACDELTYTCDLAKKEQWFELARKKGVWQLSARLDEENSSVLWIRPKPNSRLIKCKLLPRNKLYEGLPRADVVYIKEWKRNKKKSPNKDASELRYGTVKSEIDINADKEGRKRVRKRGHKKSGQSITHNRKLEQEYIKNKGAQKLDDPVEFNDVPNYRDEVVFLIQSICDEESNDE